MGSMVIDASTGLLILDLSEAKNLRQKRELLELLEQLHRALFHIGFLYFEHHGLTTVISNLVSLLSALFEQSPEVKAALLI